MRQFKDTAGRKWVLAVNVDAVKRVRDLSLVLTATPEGAHGGERGDRHYDADAEQMQHRMRPVGTQERKVEAKDGDGND